MSVVIHICWISVSITSHPLIFSRILLSNSNHFSSLVNTLQQHSSVLLFLHLNKNFLWPKIPLHLLLRFSAPVYSEPPWNTHLFQWSPLATSPSFLEPIPVILFRPTTPKTIFLLHKKWPSWYQIPSSVFSPSLINLLLLFKRYDPTFLLEKFLLFCLSFFSYFIFSQGPFHLTSPSSWKAPYPCPTPCQITAGCASPFLFRYLLKCHFLR